MKKRKIVQNHDELKKRVNIFQNTFGSVQFKFKPFSISNDVKSLQETSSNKRDTVMSKTFYLQKQVHYTFNSLILVTAKGLNRV